MGEIRVKLREYLDTHGLSAYRLVRSIEGISPNTIYAYAANRRKPTIHNLERVLSALEQLTGENVTVADLLEYNPSPSAEEIDDEARAWLDAPLAEPLEPDDHSTLSEKELPGHPVEYVPGEGLMVTVEDDV